MAAAFFMTEVPFVGGVTGPNIGVLAPVVTIVAKAMPVSAVDFHFFPMGGGNVFTAGVLGGDSFFCFLFIRILVDLRMLPGVCSPLRHRQHASRAGSCPD